MSDFFGLILGAAMSVGGGMIGFWWQRRQEGRYRFLATTAEIRAELEVSPYDSAAIFDRSRPRLAHAIHLCRPFVRQREFDCLRAIWRDYSDQNKDDLDPTKKRGLVQSL